MANSVDLVIGSEAIKQVENLISKLSLADDELIKISQSASGASKGISGISTPTGLDKAVTNTSALNAQLEKQNAIINKLHADIAKRAEQSRLSEIKLQQAREKAFDSFERNAQKEAALNAKNETAYQRIQNSVNILTKTYQDLAIRKQLNGTLTDKEEKQLISLSSRINMYQKALLTVDSQIGKNQRNVGNYASGYNALGNSINQLTREAPAFANSVNTGFMALSNNFPALFDAINGIRDKNKMLVAEGKPTVSALKSIAGALLSWQTLLSVGVTLLTLYGGKIVEFVGNAIRGKEAIKTLAENQSLLNDALKESSGSYAEEKVNIEVLYKTATNLNESYKDRKKAVDELQQLYPFYFKNLSDEDIMVGKAKDQYNLLSQAIITTAKARASDEILQKRESERLTIEQNQLLEIQKLYTKLANTKQEKTTSVSVGTGGVSVILGKEAIRKDIQKLRDESIAQRDIWAKEDAFFIKKIAEGNAIEQTLKPAETARKEKVAKDKEAMREDIVGLENHIKSVGTLIDEINIEINRLTTEKIVANADELPSINFQLEQLLKLRKQLNDVPTASKIPNIITPDVPKASMTKLKDDWEETFNAIADSAQQAGEIIAGFSEMNFKNEYARLEAQKDISLKFAGDSASAKQKIEEDYEKRRKEIANRENKAKQKQAIFNIAIDTAQAIMATVGKTGFAGLPLALILGALGAAQIAMVASQKIPEYWQGTDNASAGLAYTNERGAEIHTDKHGNIKDFGDNKGARLTMMAQGDKVYTAEETKRMMFNDDLNYMLNSRGVSMHINSQSNTMTAQQMDSIMEKHFSKIQTNSTVIDKNGFAQWTEKRGNRTIQNANRVSRTGFKV